MPAKPRPAPAARPQVADFHVDSLQAADRMTSDLADAVNAAAQRERSAVTVDLLVGTNRVTTGLSGRARGVVLSPSVASASFAWSFAAAGDREAIIVVIGVDQPDAELEFYR